VSQYQRVVLADIAVIWGEPGCSVYVKRGTMVDIIPGSQLETAYGGPSNLRTPSAAELEGDQSVIDRSALAN
jgi:hypothetical protein